MSGRGERLLVSGDYLVTLGDPAVIADGAVIIEDGRIAETGPRAVLEHHGPFSGRLGGAGYLLLPGFINAHYHSECWTARGLIGTIFEYSNLFMGAGAPVIDEEALELLATLGLVHAAKGGQTTTVDAFYGKPAMDLLGAEPAVRRLLDLGVLRDDVSFGHFVWATDTDIAIVADTGVVVVCNPGSNLRLSSGICRVRDLLAAGASVAYGTDGISFSDREDFFQEVRLAAYLQRQPDNARRPPAAETGPPVG